MTKGERAELLLLLAEPSPAYRGHHHHGRLCVQNRLVFERAWAVYFPSQLSIAFDAPPSVRAAAVAIADRVEITDAGRRAVLACARAHGPGEARLSCRRCGGVGYDPDVLAAAADARSPVAEGQRRLSANGEEEVLVQRALSKRWHPDVVGHYVYDPKRSAQVSLSYADDFIMDRWPVVLTTAP